MTTTLRFGPYYHASPQLYSDTVSKDGWFFDMFSTCLQCLLEVNQDAPEKVFFILQHVPYAMHIFKGFVMLQVNHYISVAT